MRVAKPNGYIVAIEIGDMVVESEEQEKKVKMIESQFSTWNGSHIELSRLIKDSMHDPSSYEHVETTYINE